MGEKLCGKPAPYADNMNGKVVYNCEEHHSRISALCRHMGWMMSSSLVHDHTCTQVALSEEG